MILKIWKLYFSLSITCLFQWYIGYKGQGREQQRIFSFNFLGYYISSVIDNSRIKSKYKVETASWPKEADAMSS